MFANAQGVKTTYSQHQDSRAAGRELAEGLGAEASLVVFFASIEHDVAVLAATLQQAMPQAVVTGCTTAGELISGKGCISKSVVAIALPRSIVKRVEGALLENLTLTAGNAGDVLRELSQRWGQDVRSLDPERFVGLVLPDGLSLREETLMDALGDAAPDLLVVGGSAGDDLQFKGTRIALGGKVGGNAAALLLLEVSVPFRAVKSSHFVPTDRTFIATKVDEATRTVYEFDGRPALEVYAEALGLAPEAVDVSVMAANPIGLVIGDDPFVRSFQQVGEHGEMRLYSNVLSGSEVTLLKGGDMVESTRRLIEGVEQELGGMSGALTFNCILRWVEAENTGCTQAVYATLGEKEIPAIGFQTYGEQYLGHINQTVTMLCFGK